MNFIDLQKNIDFLQEYQLNRLYLYELPSTWLSLEGFFFAYDTAGPAEGFAKNLSYKLNCIFDTF